MTTKPLPADVTVEPLTDTVIVTSWFESAPGSNAVPRLLPTVDVVA